MAVLTTVEVLRSYLTSQPVTLSWKLVRQETPGSETKGLITVAQWASQELLFASIPPFPKTHRGDARGSRWIPSQAVDCITGDLRACESTETLITKSGIVNAESELYAVRWPGWSLLPTSKIKINLLPWFHQPHHWWVSLLPLLMFSLPHFPFLTPLSWFPLTLLL